MAAGLTVDVISIVFNFDLLRYIKYVDLDLVAKKGLSNVSDGNSYRFGWCFTS